MSQKWLKTQEPFPRRLTLPEHEHIKTEQIRLGSEADYYGASFIIASLLGKKRRPRSFCTWKHGWGAFQPLKYTCQLINNSSLQGLNYLVHTQPQAEFLQKKGFGNVFAVGMPFAYIWKFFEGPARQPETLLIMPPHMSKHIDLSYREKDYLSHVLEASGDFRKVSVCVTAACDQYGRWRSTAKKLGLRVVTGGNVFDRNSLLRILSLFSEYEFVTSPDLGSHIVYASLCGCKVSLYGQVDRPPRVAYLAEPFYQRHPEVLDLAYSQESQDFREAIAFQFRSLPSDAKTHVNWAKEQAGIEQLRYLGDLSELLGWNARKQIQMAPEMAKRAIGKILSFSLPQ